MALPSQRNYYLDFEDNMLNEGFGADQGPVYTPPLSSGYISATSDGGIGADQYYTNIRDYVANVLNNADMTDFQRAENIRNAAIEYGVSNEDISRATGYGQNLVNSYLDPNRSLAAAQDNVVSGNTGALPTTTGASSVLPSSVNTFTRPTNLPLKRIHPRHP